MTFSSSTDTLLKGCNSILWDVPQSKLGAIICGGKNPFCPECKAKISQKLESERAFLEYLKCFGPGFKEKYDSVGYINFRIEDLTRSIAKLEDLK